MTCCCSVTPCIATSARGNSPRPPSRRGSRRCGPGAWPRETLTMTATRTCSSRRGWAIPSITGPTQLMMGNGDGTFHEQAAALGVEPTTDGIYLEESVGGRRAARSSRSAVVADFDGDGRLEIVTNNFNDRPYFFANWFPRRNYIEFRLTGTRSNRDAIGAVVRLRAGNTVMVRQVSPAGGYLAQSSRVVHFGLGERSKVDRIEIRWPRGTVQTLDNPAINTLHQIREPAH